MILNDFGRNRLKAIVSWDVHSSVVLVFCTSSIGHPQSLKKNNSNFIASPITKWVFQDTFFVINISPLKCSVSLWIEVCKWGNVCSYRKRLSRSAVVMLLLLCSRISQWKVKEVLWCPMHDCLLEVVVFTLCNNELFQLILWIRTLVSVCLCVLGVGNLCNTFVTNSWLLETFNMSHIPHVNANSAQKSPL